jgi:hypothetical protein
VLTRARRPDTADVVVGVAVVAAVVLLLWLGRGLTFFADEWAVMADRTISLESFIEPFNEHWLGVMIIVYRLMLETLGLGSYMPYLALLIAFHVIVVLEVYALARRVTVPAVAALAAVILAVFGSGFENLFWAMQVGFLISISLGLGALLLLEREPTRTRVVLATAMLTVGMATSGFGIFMLMLVGLDLLFDPARRRLIPALFVPGLIYLAWYAAYGRSGVANARDPFTLDAALGVPKFLLEGVGTAFGSVLGIGPLLGTLAALALASGVVVQLVRGRSVPGRTIAAFGAIVFMYGLLALIRAQLFDGAAMYSRYAYVSGIFAILGLTALIGVRAMPEAKGPRMAVLAGFVAVATLAIVWNLWLLVAGRIIFEARAAHTRAIVTVVLGEMPAGVDPDKVVLLDRTVTRLREILAEHGSPLEDSLAGDRVPPVDQTIVEEIRQELVTQAGG